MVKADDSIILTSEQELTSNIKKIEYNIVAQKPRTLESFKSQLGTTHGFFCASILPILYFEARRMKKFFKIFCCFTASGTVDDINSK